MNIFISVTQSGCDDRHRDQNVGLVIAAMLTLLYPFDEVDWRDE